MFHTASKAGASFVTPFVGVWIEIKHSAGFGQLNMSLPLWECGLKLSSWITMQSPDLVTPLVRVWIEIA